MNMPPIIIKIALNLKMPDVSSKETVKTARSMTEDTSPADDKVLNIDRLMSKVVPKNTQVVNTQPILKDRNGVIEAARERLKKKRLNYTSKPLIYG